MSFPKKTFLPYKSYRMTLSVQKGDRESNFQVIILFQELDLPQLALDIPPNILTSRVNLNDEIFITMMYDS